MNLEEIAKTTGYSVDDLEKLTDQERQDLLDGEEFDEETEIELDPNTGEPVNEDGEAEHNNESEQEPEPEPTRDDGKDPEPESKEPEVEPEKVAKPTPQAPVTQLPSDYDEQVKAIADKKTEVFDKFENGDLSAAEYHKQLDALSKDERKLERIKERAEYDEQQAAHNWVNVTVSSFLNQHPQYQGNQGLLNALDMEVRALQSQSGNMFDPSHLANAHERVKDQFAPMFVSATKAPAKEPRTAPSLANTPASDIDEPSAGEFDYLDRLAASDPIRYEDELLKLQSSSPSKYDQYMAS